MITLMAAAVAAQSAAEAFTSGSSSSSLLILLVPLFGPPNFLKLILYALLICIIASVLFRYLTIIHIRKQQQLLRSAASAAAAAVAGVSIHAAANSATTAVASVAGKRGKVFEEYILLALLIKDVASSIFWKGFMLLYSLLFLCCSWEERGLKEAIERERLRPEDSDLIERRTIVFIRHGESVWNATFNRPLLSFFFPLRFFLFWFWEFFLAAERDSVLFDSPLSTQGIVQAAELRAAFREKPAPLAVVAAAVAAAAARSSIDTNSIDASSIDASCIDAKKSASGSIDSVRRGVQSSCAYLVSEEVAKVKDGAHQKKHCGTAVELREISRSVAEGGKELAAVAAAEKKEQQQHDCTTGFSSISSCHQRISVERTSSTLTLAGNGSSPVSAGHAVSSRISSSSACFRSAVAAAKCGAAGAEALPAEEITSVSAETNSFSAQSLQQNTVNLQLVSSNLRRALSTLFIALGPSIQSHTQPVQILSCLQEATRFPDALSLSSAPFSVFSTPGSRTAAAAAAAAPVAAAAASRRKERSLPLSQLEQTVVGASLVQLYANHVDTSFNYGNKSLFCAVVQRLQQFAAWLFTAPDTTVSAASAKKHLQLLLVVGHSRWLRYFFQLYYPADLAFAAKEKKLSNCGVLKFDVLRLLQRKGGRVDYYIDPLSCQLLRGGFYS